MKWGGRIDESLMLQIITLMLFNQEYYSFYKIFLRKDNIEEILFDINSKLTIEFATLLTCHFSKDEYGHYCQTKN